MIYLDNAATTKVYNDVIYLIRLYAEEQFYNPSALYREALAVSKAVASARESVAALIGAKPQEIVFTGGGSESDNMAIFGAVKQKNKKILTCVAEHAAVYNCFRALAAGGYNVEYCAATPWGGVDEGDLFARLTPDTQLVSVMHVNNETGAVNDLKALTQRIKRVAPRCIVHSDGVQAFGKLAVDVKDLGVDLYSFSGHKIHCVKGIGGLYVKSGIAIPPLIYGGGQEGGRRGGTENVAGIAALAKAAELAEKALTRNTECVANLKWAFLAELKEHLDEYVCNSPLERTSNYIVSLSIRGVKAEVLMHLLNEDGILVGLGSACSSHSKAQRVTDALGLSREDAEGTIRVSFCGDNTEEEARFSARKIAEHAAKLRAKRGRNADE